MAAATISPGSAGSVGTLNLGNLVTSPGNALAFTVGSVSDLIQVAGPFTATGNVVITPGAQFGPGTYTLVSSAGPMAVGTLTPAVLAIVSGGHTYAAFLQVAGNTLQLVVDDGTPPQVTQIATDVGSGTYYWQQVINITVTFNKPVQLAGGNLYLSLNAHQLPDANPVVVGSVPALTQDIVATYTVSLFDWTPKLTTWWRCPLDPGATLRNFANNDAILALPPPSGATSRWPHQPDRGDRQPGAGDQRQRTLNLPIHTIALIDATLLSATDFRDPEPADLHPDLAAVAGPAPAPGRRDLAGRHRERAWQHLDPERHRQRQPARYFHNGANAGNDIFFFTVTDVFIANSDGLSKARHPRSPRSASSPSACTAAGDGQPLQCQPGVRGEQHHAHPHRRRQ